MVCFSGEKSVNAIFFLKSNKFLHRNITLEVHDWNGGSISFRVQDCATK